jgi:hypothetical protein
LIRYYGWPACRSLGVGRYSNKSRGLRAKSESPAVFPTGEASAPGAKAARKRWAALIKQVYEADPLSCPRCGAEMKIISFTCLPAGRSSGISEK